MEAGNTLRAQKDYAGAIAKYEAALGNESCTAEVYGDIARIYAEQGKNDEAVAAYKKFIEAKPDNPKQKWNWLHCFCNKKMLMKPKHF